ncbi:WD40 repeat domain-containing protein [Candidatus Azambacteria bacterium]|nr:WD40 repeat domain-containing protein [Candidatus Azambacteria bacterium]
MTKKRIILIVLVLLVLIMGALAAYYFFFKKPGVTVQEPAAGTEQPAPEGENIVAIDEKLKRISATPAISPIAAADGSRVLYAGKTSGVFEVDFSGGNQKETTFTPLKNLYKIFWSKDRNEFAAVYASQDGRKTFYYNTQTKQTSPYDTHIDSLAFSPVENKLAYHYQETGGGINNISVADPSGANAATVINTRLQEARIAWITQNEIALSTAPSGLAPNLLWVLNTSTQKLSTALTDIYGLTTLWAPDGERFLFSQTSQKGKGLSLSVADKKGTSVKKLDLTTLPEKCVFAKDKKSAVCAAPAIMPDIVWPDDYYKNIYSAQEQLWRVNLESGKKEMLYEFAGISFDAASLLLSPQEDVLVFLNRKDGFLYSVKLK